MLYEYYSQRKTSHYHHYINRWQSSAMQSTRLLESLQNSELYILQSYFQGAFTTSKVGMFIIFSHILLRGVSLNSSPENIVGLGIQFLNLGIPCIIISDKTITFVKLKCHFRLFQLNYRFQMSDKNHSILRVLLEGFKDNELVVWMCQSSTLKILL